jgi:nucleotide-binding universal stress UspA family protein
MADSRAWLEKFSHEAKTGNIELKTELTNSHRLVDYVILEYAEEKNIDLIVVGTRGRSGFKRLLLGSVASSVVSYAHCPVMIVVKRARRYFLLEAHFVRSSNKLHNNFH